MRAYGADALASTARTPFYGLYDIADVFGTVLVIVDQPASIGALPLTVARDAGCKVAYPTRTSNRIRGCLPSSIPRWNASSAPA